MLKQFILTFFVLAFTVFLMNCQDSQNLITSSGSEPLEETSFAKAIVSNYEELEFYDLILSGECLGEDLHFYGYLLRKDHITITPNGIFHLVMRWVPIDMTATGVTSGGTWDINYHDVEIQHSGNAGSVYHVAGHGLYKANQPGPDLREHWMFHINVNANGETTVTRETVRIECFGQ